MIAGGRGKPINLDNEEGLRVSKSLWIKGGLRGGVLASGGLFYVSVNNLYSCAGPAAFR